jgi:hypothetical protein
MTRVKLTERVVAAKIWQTPRGKEKVIVATFNPYQGRDFFDLRENVIGPDGIMRPSPHHGFAVVIEKLPELHSAIGRALAKARELNLLPADDEADAP